ncbi:MAG: UDP-N-acetylglucosamine--N-acetylmuramyl-(pentapeptide) pyrophosphoryl-undecaprenol N-acetylglucosamine transferase [Candidatus Sungbacteria bacterium]|uniref:UDP-N-acetylglucosamine--N-acetylmuramyl-(pentapeptide) pyrophosphoryl-undecaprenol N-acetylglucosamine transferase n=1 Tax=Candidatus Sungiibacteriota bacterium TaxID=2750080 RepID=A0A9D6LTD5_9BACT|nr:UDP-N-acetylglucosamine--N-acetylmuramyl-(pentapeptide) pyrophosphoryl-undecaprenol N-acetylglucosamine transferase [Candidatus Sungbacteria bacterium]
MRVLFTGGGTGGHFFPIIAIARELRIIAEEERILDVSLYYLGPNIFPPDVLTREEILPDTILAGKMRRYFSVKNISDIFKTAAGIIQALWKMFLLMPDVVFSKGGFGAFPAVLAARIYHIPVIIHESDMVPGRVNRWSARFARRIAVAFPKAAAYFPKEKTAVVGNPIRKRILGALASEAKDHFSIFSQKKVLLVLGGSQGAEPINQLIIGGLDDFVKDYEIIHQTGAANYADIMKESSVILKKATQGFYHPYPFLNETQYREAFAACDLVISRASSTIFEIAAAAKPAILIPLPHAAQDHQRANAYEYARTGAAIVIEENNATPFLVRHTLSRIFDSPEELHRMREGAQRFARIDSAEILAREILAIAVKH